MAFAANVTEFFLVASYKKYNSKLSTLLIKKMS
jgi:hypothetical protein